MGFMPLRSTVLWRPLVVSYYRRTVSGVCQTESEQTVGYYSIEMCEN
jgi:hypothetical protein